MTRNYLARSVAAVLVLGASAGVLQPASATLVSADFSFTPPQSDCAGFFGRGFSNCLVNDSPSIIKYQNGDSGTDYDDLNTLFTAVLTGEEFEIDWDNGTWTYTPGDGDPEIRYWVMKFGAGVASLPDFRLLWEVEGTPDECSPETYTPACLDLALPLTAGSWDAGAIGGALSHITFYDTGSTSNGGGPTQVPTPGSLALLGIGALAGGFRLRRRRSEAST